MSKNWNDNKKKSNYNNDVKTAKSTLPYRFVPVKGENKKIDRVDLNKYDEKLFSGKLFCSLYGVNPLCVGNTHEENKENIYNQKERKTIETNYTTIEPLKINKKLAISPYTLKGAISNFLAAYVGNPMTRVEKKGFLFRPNINIPNKKDYEEGIKYYISGGIITEINEEEEFVEVLKIGNIPKVKDKRVSGIPKFGCNSRNNYCSGGKGNRFSNIKVSSFDEEGLISGTIKELELYKNGPKAPFYFFNYSNGIDGEGKLLSKFFQFNTGPTNAKYHDYVMFSKKDINRAIDDENYLYIENYKRKEFEKTYDFLELYHLKNHPYVDTDELDSLKKNFKKMRELNVGDVIFFEYDINQFKPSYKYSPEVITFGKTFYYPWAYSRELSKRWFPKDIGYLEDEFVDDKISILRDMFGYILGKDDKELLDEKIIDNMNKNAKSGKVHFNFATYEGGGDIVNNKILPRPGTPKPSSYEFYLQQNGKTPLTTYGDPARDDYKFDNEENVRLSGRKFYMKHKKVYLSLKDLNRGEIEDYSIILNEVLMGTKENPSKFKFTVNFENLTKEQLELLTFSLNLNENNNLNENTLYHQIGYGKNYGMGAIKIEVDKAQIVKLEDKKLSLNKYSLKELQEKNGLSISKLKNSLNNNFKNILKMHTTEFHYPKLGRADDATIKWHSNVRGEDFKKRRK